jgi:hypothetical protein
MVNQEAAPFPSCCMGVVWFVNEPTASTSLNLAVKLGYRKGRVWGIIGVPRQKQGATCVSAI